MKYCNRSRPSTVHTNGTTETTEDDTYKENEGNKIQELLSTFNFAFVGEFIERKNLKALIQAFHMEFSCDEPVNLFIKTSKVSLPEVQNHIKSIKSGLKIRKTYKEEIIITGWKY